MPLTSGMFQSDSTMSGLSARTAASPSAPSAAAAKLVAIEK